MAEKFYPTNKGKREWSAPGALWIEEKNMTPSCDYCSDDIDSAGTLYQCYWSGTTFCGGCWDEHADSMINDSEEVQRVDT